MARRPSWTAAGSPRRIFGRSALSAPVAWSAILAAVVRRSSSWASSRCGGPRRARPRRGGAGGRQPRRAPPSVRVSPSGAMNGASPVIVAPPVGVSGPAGQVRRALFATGPQCGQVSTCLASAAWHCGQTQPCRSMVAPGSGSVSSEGPAVRAATSRRPRAGEGPSSNPRCAKCERFSRL